MGDSERTRGSDELIDIGGFEEEELTELEAEDEVTPLRLREKKLKKKDAPAKITAEIPQMGIYIATLRERFVALTIDTILLFYLYFAYAAAYCRFILGSWERQIPYSGMHGAILHASFLLIYFFYYFALESIGLTTIGKFACWMSVRKKNGEPPGFFTIFLRNIFRFLDYILIIPVVFIMEKSRTKQRLGDIIAGTTVVKKHASVPGTYSVSDESIASASGRAVAAVIDLIFFAPFILGYLLTLNPDRPHISQWILMCAPAAVIFYFVLIEMITETTPGKWLMGYIICQDNGRRLTFSGSFLRTVWLLFDANPMGWLCVFLSSKRARPGDTAAGTLVVKKRNLKGAIGAGIAILLAVGTMYLGLTNEKNFRHPSFRVNFLPKLAFISNLGFEIKEFENLEITNVRFAVNDPTKLISPPSYRGGEIVYLLFDVRGFVKQGRKAWIEEDVRVVYPDGTAGLSQENVSPGPQILDDKSKKTLAFENPIPLPSNAAPGVYQIQITLRDKFGDSQIKEVFQFFVRRTQISIPPTGDENTPAE